MSNRKNIKGTFSNLSPSDECMERIFDMTVNKKTKKIPFKRIIAVVAVIAVVCSVTSVSAANHFKPDNAFNQFIELNKDVDYSTLGADINATASSNNIDFSIEKVMCDNTIMILPVRCPQYNGRYVYPKSYIFGDDEYFEITVDGKEQCLSISGYTNEKDSTDNTLYLTFDGLKDVRQNSNIKIRFNTLAYFDSEILADESIEECPVQGEWEFNFTINRNNVRQKIDVEDIKLDNGEQYIFSKFTVSPLGFACEFDVKGWDKEKEFDPKSGRCTLFSESVSSGLNGKGILFIEMKDGTIFSDGDKGDKRIDMNVGTSIKYNMFMSGEVHGVFMQNINVDDIEKITLLNEVIYQK